MGVMGTGLLRYFFVNCIASFSISCAFTNHISRSQRSVKEVYGYYNYVGCMVWYKMSCVCVVLVA